MMAEAKMHRPSRGARSLSREFALLGIYEWLVSAADAVTIERTLLSVLSDDGEPVAGAAIDAADFERCDKNISLNCSPASSIMPKSCNAFCQACRPRNFSPVAGRTLCAPRGNL